VGFDVADGEVPGGDGELRGDAEALAGEVDFGLAGGFVEDFDVGPGDFAGPAGAEDFEDGFFSGEAAGEVFDVAFWVFGAVGLFEGSEAAVEEALAMVAEELGDAGGFDDVDAVADDHEWKGKVWRGDLTRGGRGGKNRGMASALEQLKYDEKGLIPVIVQEVRNGQVLMMAWMNREALEKTLETGKVHTYSRSRGRLALKGESSGHFQQVKEVYTDCDKDVVLVKAEQVVAACHEGYRSCFFRQYEKGSGEWKVVGEKAFDPEAVYRKK